MFGYNTVVGSIDKVAMGFGCRVVNNNSCSMHWKWE